VKEYLSTKGINFQELNVTDDLYARDQLITKVGRMVVPVVVVDDEVVIGFNRPELERLLS